MEQPQGRRITTPSLPFLPGMATGLPSDPHAPSLPLGTASRTFARTGPWLLHAPVDSIPSQAQSYPARLPDFLPPPCRSPVAGVALESTTSPACPRVAPLTSFHWEEMEHSSQQASRQHAVGITAHESSKLCLTTDFWKAASKQSVRGGLFSSGGRGSPACGARMRWMFCLTSLMS